jgi:hypothetical protein
MIARLLGMPLDALRWICGPPASVDRSPDHFDSKAKVWSVPLPFFLTHLGQAKNRVEA